MGILNLLPREAKNIALSTDRIWASAMKLALQARNKFAFVNGTCVKNAFVTSDVLFVLWDRCNVVLLTWILNFVSQDAYMGLIYFVDVAFVCKELEETYDKVDGFDDCYQCVRSSLLSKDILLKCVRSSLLSKDPLLKVKDADIIVSRQGSYSGIHESSSVTECKLNTTSFAANSFNTLKEDLKREIISGNGIESGGLYLSDLNFDRLGHSIDQVLATLKHDLNMSKSTSVFVYEICHIAKQKREPFPLSDPKSKKLNELVHLDLWGPIQSYKQR
nr:hypothetical protein [Tanacetum cinerariifolium]